MILNPALDLEAFFAGLERAPKRALLLDYDGTVAPFRSERDEVRTYDGVDAIIQRLSSTPACRVIFVSGRGARDLAARIQGTAHPEIWGSHGGERLRPDGTLVTTPVPAVALRILETERDRIRGNSHAAWFEFKPLGIALHVRGRAMPEAALLLASTRAHWASLAATNGLRLSDFDGGVELHVAAANKGTAVEALLAELGPGAVAAFLGDDRTDEDAFLALRGNGLAVLVRATLRPTAADLWLEPPHDLLQFLARWESAVTTGGVCG